MEASLNNPIKCSPRRIGHDVTMQSQPSVTTNESSDSKEVSSVSGHQTPQGLGSSFPKSTAPVDEHTYKRSNSHPSVKFSVGRSKRNRSTDENEAHDSAEHTNGLHRASTSPQIRTVLKTSSVLSSVAGPNTCVVSEKCSNREGLYESNGGENIGSNQSPKRTEMGEAITGDSSPNNEADNTLAFEPVANCTLSDRSSLESKRGSLMESGIPLNISPKNIVLRFDKNRDNISFSTISEDSEYSSTSVGNRSNWVATQAKSVDNTMEKTCDNQSISSNGKGASDNQSVCSRDLSCASRDSASQILTNGLDPAALSASGNQSVTSNRSNNNKTADAKKRKGYWYNVLSPNYKSKSEDFRKIFKDVPDTERLIVDYSCAMQKDILVHGRLYVTQNWICFYANIFKWETVVTLQCREITTITKEKTARVIPNAISITAGDERYFFTSFAARDKSYLMLFRVWQNALCDVQMNPAELWQWVHHSYGDELGLTSSDDDYVPPDTECRDLLLESPEPPISSSPCSYQKIPEPTATSPCSYQQEPGESSYSSVRQTSPDPSQTDMYPSGGQSTNDNNNGSLQKTSRTRRPPSTLDSDVQQRNRRHRSWVPAPGGPSSSGTSTSSVGRRMESAKTLQGDPHETTPIDMGDTTEDDELDTVGEVQCSNHEHNGFTSLDDVFNIPVDKLFNLIFTDSQLYRDFIAARKTFDFVTEPWPEEPSPEDGNRVRNISYTLSLNYSIGPKTSPSTEKQTWFGAHNKSGCIYVVDTEVVNGGVPYSDNFYVVNRYCLTRVTAQRSRLRITSQIKYRKNCWGLVKSVIEPRAVTALKEAFKMLGYFIEKNGTAGILEAFTFLGEFLHREGERSIAALGGTQGSKKKVLKRRRGTTQHSGIEIRDPSAHVTQSKMAAVGSGGAAGALAGAETRRAMGPQRVVSGGEGQAGVDTLVKVMCFVLLLLVLFNGVLYFKLYSLEQQAASLPQHHFTTVPQPKTSEEWLLLLDQQEQVHHAELARWQDILGASIQLMDQMKQSLEHLRYGLAERRAGFHYSSNAAAYEGMGSADSAGSGEGMGEAPCRKPQQQDSAHAYQREGQQETFQEQGKERPPVTVS